MNAITRPLQRLPVVALVAALAFAASAQESEHRLPELGSSANALLTPAEARQIGGSMLLQMRALNMVIDDGELNRYVNDVGYRLVAHAGIQKGMRFTFFVVRDNGINAFAAPGGYIGVNAGLITATEDESELAGVLAHEIAHITQHHLERAEEDARKMSPLMALAMLGAAVVASQSGSGDAAPAAVAAGMGLMAQRQINFTRKDEAEADRIGIDTLAAAGFDVDGMAGFFGRMERLMRPGAGSIQVPEFLRTHPITSNRISEAKALAHVIKQRQAHAPKRAIGKDMQWHDSTAPLAWLRSPSALDATHDDNGVRYRLMRERTRVLSADNDGELLTYYRGNLERGKGFDTLANHYGYALALTRGGKADAALKELQPLLASHPDNLDLQLAEADALRHSGQVAAALGRYAGLSARRPTDKVIAGAYADALLSTAKRDDARKAAALLRPLLDDEVEDPTLYRTFGRALDRSGQDVRAAEAYADASYLSGHASDALDQLQRLLKRKDLDYYARARIQARVEYITPIALELARRGITADKQGL